MSTTLSDEAGSGWAIDDPVVRLRVWGHASCFELHPHQEEHVLGAAPDVSIQLVDATGCVSRRHAVLTREDKLWTIRDLGSTNGIRQDGERRLSFQLAPGVEIEIGGATLIAESARLIALRELLARLLGWDPKRAAEIDRALRAVREMATLRAALIVTGDGDLTAIARRLHAHTLGDSAPFVVCGPDSDAADALQQASTGMLCLVAGRLPSDVQRIATSVTAPGARRRIVICAWDAARASKVAMHFGRTATIAITPIADRRHELERLVAEYASDAVSALGAPGTGLREYDLERLRALDLTTLDQLDEVALRLVAERNWGVTGGAERLGISHVALSKWMRHRNIPT
jgi:hypothetical protein